MLHPLIRDWLQLRVCLKERQTYTHQVIDMIVSSLQTYAKRGSDAMAKQSVLLHMDAVIMTMKDFFKDGHQLGQDIMSCINAGIFASFYQDQGRFKASLDLYCTVLATMVRVLGKDNQGTLTVLNNVAMVLADQAMYNEAEQTHREVGERSKRLLGKEYPETQASMNNLASVLMRQGKYIEAEQTYREVLGASMRLLGREHSTTLYTMNSLATMMTHQGKYNEAEQMHREVVEAEERVLGNEYQLILASKGNFAVVLRDQKSILRQSRCVGKW